MATIAILGYGTVGSGVLEVLRRNAASIERRAGQPVTVKYICDIRDFSSHPDAALFVNNIDVILSDPEVTAVVETIGGLKPAYFYVKSALESGRHVVTSNKELVATHGAELLAIARRRGVCFLFEASVGGGTPIITPMHQCMAANVISEIAGIVNGTTNFMLTKMARENMDFGAALKLAQGLGYAETIDPSADVDGIDAQRKISILASLAFGRHFFPQNVPTRGIRDVSVKDIALAARQGAAVRLIAWARRGDDGSVALAVEPMLIPRENQLAGVEDVFNAVLVKGDMLGDVVFYGKGAGKLPTASAVVADVIDALKNGVKIHDSLFWQESAPIEGLYGDSTPADHYVRLENATEAVAKDLFGQQIEMLDTSDGEAVFTLRGVTSGRLAELCAKARAAGVNAVLVKGDMLGDVVFYGKGAGKLPTASAVVADVIDALKNGVKIHDSLFWQESAPIEGLYGDSTPADHYVRLENATEAVAKDLFGQQIEMLDTSDGEAVFTLRGVTSGRLAELCAKARAAGVRVGNTLKWMAE